MGTAQFLQGTIAPGVPPACPGWAGRTSAPSPACPFRCLPPLPRHVHGWVKRPPQPPLCVRAGGEAGGEVAKPGSLRKQSTRSRRKKTFCACHVGATGFRGPKSLSFEGPSQPQEVPQSKSRSLGVPSREIVIRFVGAMRAPKVGRKLPRCEFHSSSWGQGGVKHASSGGRLGASSESRSLERLL